MKNVLNHNKKSDCIATQFVSNNNQHPHRHHQVNLLLHFWCWLMHLVASFYVAKFFSLSLFCFCFNFFSTLFSSIINSKHIKNFDRMKNKNKKKEPEQNWDVYMWGEMKEMKNELRPNSVCKYNLWNLFLVVQFQCPDTDVTSTYSMLMVDVVVVVGVDWCVVLCCAVDGRWSICITM